MRNSRKSELLPSHYCWTSHHSDSAASPNLCTQHGAPQHGAAERILRHCRKRTKPGLEFTIQPRHSVSKFKTWNLIIIEYLQESSLKTNWASPINPSQAEKVFSMLPWCIATIDLDCASLKFVGESRRNCCRRLWSSSRMLHGTH